MEIKVTSQLTKQQLLIPRYLCTGTPEKPLWPGCQWEDGLIISEDQIFSIGKYATDFPHLFKTLPWWYGRTVEEMPLYLKSIRNASFVEVKEYRIEHGCFMTDEQFPKSLSLFEPATAEEYLNYKNFTENC